MERRFIRSGIPGLDSILGGGILDGSVITVSGPTGVGKSTLAAQFLYNGAAESNEPGLYICLEESRRDFLFHNSGYEWDFQTLEKDHKFILLDYPIHEVDQIVTQSAAIAEIINNTGTRRVVIDSIMPIALYFKSEDERKRGFLKLIDSLHKWNVTTLIVSEDIKMANSGARPSSEFGIESFTDGWINMFYKYDDRTMDRSRYLEVIKMKGIAHNHRAFPAVLGNSGFSIIHELTGPSPKQAKAKPPPPKPEKPPEETVVSIEPGELTLPHPAAEEEPQRPESKRPPVPEPPLRPLSSKRKLVKDEEMEQLKKLLEEEATEKKKPAPKSGGESPDRPPPSGKPPAPPPRQAPAAKAPPAKAQPKIAPRPSGRPAPAKMSPSIQARLEEVKKKIMKKK